MTKNVIARSYLNAMRHCRGYAVRVAIALVLGASSAIAQSTPPVARPPARPDSSSSAPLRKPVELPPPPRPAALPAAATAARRTPTAPLTLAAPAKAATPPESLSTSVKAGANAPPPNAVAHCSDGAYVVPPAPASACAQHGGLRAAFQRSAPPPRPGTATASTQPARSVAVAPAAIPIGATMHCKDGTYLSGTPAADRCANNGGLAAILPVQRANPTTPRAPSRP